MSILPNQTNINKDTYFFLLVDAKVINTSTINANTGFYDKLFVNTISTGSVLVNSISSLTGNISSLNTNSISSGTGYISSFFTDSINVSSLIGQTGFISSLFSDNVRVSSIEGQTGFISSLYSDTIKVSSIEAQTANISSLNLNKAYFSSLIGDNISTNYISTNSLNSRSISTINLSSSNISSQNLSSSNIFFDTLNGTAGNITTLTGTDLVYSNIYAQILNADVTVFNSTSVGYLVANNISTAFINSSNGLFTNLFTSTITSHKGIFQSTATGLLIVNNISTGFIYGASALFNNLTASNLNISSFSTLAINVSSINTNNISSGVINTSNITSYNITNSNLLSNAGDAQLNTLTTSGTLTANGALNTNNTLNMGGGMNMNSDITGQFNNVTLLIPPFTTSKQYLRDINDIRTGNFQTVNIVGGSTGNTILPDYFEYSELNIGATETSPAIVNIYGVNAELTTALTVYGITSFNGDTTINGLTTVNGITDLNGDLTVIGLTSITGDTDIIGLTSITGNTDINGACEITGETNILGLLTAEAGIGIVGATTIQGGDITIGSSSGGVTNNFNLYNYYNGTDIQNLTTNGFGDFRQNVNIDSNLTVGGIIFGTVVSGSESVSTIGVSTLRAFNISTTYLTAGQAFINSISTGSLSGGTGVFNSISTNYISTGILNVSEGIFNSISTNSISTGYISTGSISADILNFKEATGQLLNFKGEVGGSAGIGFYREIDGIPEFDTAILTNNVEGFTILSLSTINLRADKEVNISSLTNINLNTNSGFTNIQYASTGSLYTSTLNADSIYSFSTLTSTINFTSAKGQLIELQVPPDDTAGLILYRTIDGVQEPDTIIGIQNSAGFTIQSLSTISIQAPYESIIINSGKLLGLAATNLVVVDAPSLVVNSNATISSINTEQITASNVSSIYSQMNYATVLNDLSANNLFTNSLYTIFIGNPLPYQAPITFNANLNISGNDIYNTATLSASNISTNFLSTGSLFVNNYTGDSISSLSISSGSLFVNNYIGNSISTNFLSTGSLFVNNSVENSISSLRISSGSVFSGAVSTLQLGVSSITTNTILSRTTGIDRLTGGPVSQFNTFTNNLFPNSATSGVGYGPTSAGAGYYKDGYFRSTFTSVIQPDAVAGQLSNVVRINGNVSTQNQMVSSINLKQYPTRSTIGGPFFPSSFTLDGTTATTPQLLISSINFFAGAGNYDISQRMAYIKLTGGNSVDAHGSILVASTNTLLIPDSNTGYGQLPQVNDVGHSTFTTLYTSITVGTNSFQRQYKYLDTTGGNYTGSLYLERPVITYIPSQGLNPE